MDKHLLILIYISLITCKVKLIFTVFFFLFNFEYCQLCLFLSFILCYSSFILLNRCSLYIIDVSFFSNTSTVFSSCCLLIVFLYLWLYIEVLNLSSFCFLIMKFIILTCKGMWKFKNYSVSFVVKEATIFSNQTNRYLFNIYYVLSVMDNKKNEI